MQNRGFTLIEILVTVAILAILAAVALPSYQNYVIRSKMVEAYMLMDSLRPEVEEYFEVNGVMPFDDAEIGLDIESPIDEVISAVSLLGHHQRIHSTLYVMLRQGVVDGLSHSDAAFGIRATPHPEGHLSWECVRYELDAKYLPADCR